MISTRRKKQQNKKPFSQLSERDTYFMMGQSNHCVQNENTDSVIYRITSSGSTNNLTQVNYLQVDMHTLEENIVNKVRSGVANVIKTVETRVQEAVLTVIKVL